MKPPFLFIVLIVSFLPVSAQNNFNQKSGQVFWQNIYNYKYNQQLIPGTEITTQTDSVIHFKITGYEVPEAENNKTIVILASAMTATGTIEIKPGKYKVTISGIEFINPFDLASKVPFTTAITKKGAIRTDKKAVKSLQLMNNGFTQLFEPQKTTW